MVASVGGAGLSPVAPGTVGSLVVGALAAARASPIAEPRLWALVAILACSLGTWAAWELGRASQDRDASYIVIDEVAGMAIAGALAQGVLEWSIAFVLFRLFDVWKPGPIRWVDRASKHHPQAWVRAFGIQLDDVLAGTLALGLAAPVTRLVRSFVAPLLS